MAYHTGNTSLPSSRGLSMSVNSGDSGINIENVDAQSRISLGNQPPAEEPLTLNTASLFGEIKFQVSPLIIRRESSFFYNHRRRIWNPRG